MAFSITQVRHDEAQAHAIMRVYVFGGLFGTDRPPRGIAPAHWLDFIVQHVPQGGGANVYQKTLQALRFYELDAAVPHLLRTLELPVVGRDDVQRCCAAIQAAADLGQPSDELLARLCEFFDTQLVPHPEALGLWPLLMDTRVVLTPHGSDAALEQRLADEVAAKQLHEREGEAEMMAYDAVAAVQRNDLPRAHRCADAKRALLAMTDEAARVAALVDTYLGRRWLGTLLEEWAARMLRRAALVDAEPVWSALRAAIDAIDPAKPAAQIDLELVRAAQAILYLGGSLSPALHERYAAAQGVANFLWDDPG
jgi:hypothetical protein